MQAYVKTLEGLLNARSATLPKEVPVAVDCLNWAAPNEVGFGERDGAYLFVEYLKKETVDVGGIQMENYSQKRIVLSRENTGRPSADKFFIYVSRNVAEAMTRSDYSYFPHATILTSSITGGLELWRPGFSLVVPVLRAGNQGIAASHNIVDVDEIVRSTVGWPAGRLFSLWWEEKPFGDINNTILQTMNSAIVVAFAGFVNRHVGRLIVLGAVGMDSIAYYFTAQWLIYYVKLDINLWRENLVRRRIEKQRIGQPKNQPDDADWTVMVEASKKKPQELIRRGIAVRYFVTIKSAVDAARRENRNVFIYAPSGSGKTHFLRNFTDMSGDRDPSARQRTTEAISNLEMLSKAALVASRMQE